MKTPTITIEESGALREIAQLEKGKFLGRVEEEFRKVVAAGHSHGGKGQITITLHFDTSLKEGSARVHLSGVVKGKVPDQKPGVSVRFANERGELSKEEWEDVELELSEGPKVTAIGEGRGSSKHQAPSSKEAPMPKSQRRAAGE